MCSEMYENEHTIDCITVAYKYQFKKPGNLEKNMIIPTIPLKQPEDNTVKMIVL